MGLGAQLRVWVGGAPPKLSGPGSHLCSGLLRRPSLCRGETENECRRSEGMRKRTRQNRKKGRRPEGREGGDNGDLGRD